MCMIGHAQGSTNKKKFFRNAWEFVFALAQHSRDFGLSIFFFFPHHRHNEDQREMLTAPLAMPSVSAMQEVAGLELLVDYRKLISVPPDSTHERAREIDKGTRHRYRKDTQHLADVAV